MVEKNNAGAVAMQADYVYDALDQRIEKLVDLDAAGADAALATFFVYDGVEIAEALLADVSLKNRFLHGPPSLQAKLGHPGR